MTDHEGPGIRDDGLRHRLARLDPAAGQSVPPVTDQARERAMSTDPTAPEATTAPEAQSRSTWTPRVLGGAAAAVVLAAGVIAVLVVSGDDGESGPATATGATLELAVEPVNISAACLRPDATQLRMAEVAFAGTVVDVNGTGAVLDVERFYKGGDGQEQVSLSQDGGPETGALTGITFNEGLTYLVNATDGVVGMCSGSGTDSPQLRALFDEAYG